MADWQNLVKQVAPWVAAAATGGVPALVGMAAVTVGKAMGQDVKPTMDAIGAAISGATPEQLLAIKSADQQFALQMQKLGFENEQALEAIAAGDRDSARKRETATGDWTPRVLGILVIFLTALGEGALLTGFEPRVAPELVGRILGTLDMATMMVLTYFFGSTSGSARKTEILAEKPT